MNDWHMQRQLYGSPYSGCRCFTGWPKPPQGPQIKQQLLPNSLGARRSAFCVDRVQRPRPTVQNVQRASFRPSSPYPSWVLGPGGDPVKPMPCVIRPPIRKPPYSIAKGIRGPSATGPFTYGIAGGIISGGMPFVVGTGGSSQHNLGYT